MAYTTKAERRAADKLKEAINSKDYLSTEMALEVVQDIVDATIKLMEERERNRKL